MRTRVTLPTASAASIWNTVAVAGTSTLKRLSAPAPSVTGRPLTSSAPSRTLSATVPSSRMPEPPRVALSMITAGPSRSTRMSERNTASTSGVISSSGGMN